MGERGAQQEPPTVDNLNQMRALTAEALRAGAIGVTTSRHIGHRSKAGDLAPSLYSEADELLALAGGLKDAGAGVMQLITFLQGHARDEFALMRRIVEASGRPLSFSLLQISTDPHSTWCDYLGLLDGANADGLPIRGQVYPRPVGLFYGLDLSFHPFSLHPSFKPLVDRPLAEKVKAMRDPAFRARLLSEQPRTPILSRFG